MKPVVTGVACVVLATLWPAESVARQPRTPPDVVMIGSSSMGGSLGWIIQRRLQEVGHVVRRKYRTAAGLCRPDFYDWHEAVRELPITDHTKAVVVYLGGNDGQGIWLHPEERKVSPDRRWPSKWIRFGTPEWAPAYRDRVTALVDDICELGARRVLWLSIVNSRGERWERKYAAIRPVQRDGVGRSKCGVYVDTTGDTAVLGTREERRHARLRTSDGVHATRLGARTIWARIGDVVLREVEARSDLLEHDPEPAVAGP